MAITKPVYDKKKAVAKTGTPIVKTTTGTIANPIASNPTATAAKVGTSRVLKGVPQRALSIPKKTNVVVRDIGRVLPKNKKVVVRDIGKVLPKATTKGSGTAIKSAKQNAANKTASSNALTAYKAYLAAGKNANVSRLPGVKPMPKNTNKGSATRVPTNKANKMLNNKSNKSTNNKPNKGTKKTNNSAKGTKKTNTKYNLKRRTNNAVKLVNRRFNKYQNAYNKIVNKQRNADIKASNAQYNANAQQAALRNAVQQRELQRQMYRNGITGGASESTMMNQANNYANQQGKIASDKAASANTIRQKANADKASFRLQNMQNRATAIDSAKDREYNKYLNWRKSKDDLRKERKADKRYRAETKYSHKQDRLARKDRLNERRYNRKMDTRNRYAQTVSGYDTVKAINKKIKKIRKSGKNKWRIAYLKQQRAAVRERDWERAHRNDK